MTNDQLNYESPRTDFKYLRIVFRIITVLIAIIVLLFLLRCGNLI